jgi:hypothetical protein
MSFNAAGLRKVLDLGMSDPRSMWLYETADAHTTVDNADYFTAVSVPIRNFTPGAVNLGMQVGDLVVVRTTGNGATTLHSVTAVSATGDASLSAAVLA